MVDLDDDIILFQGDCLSVMPTIKSGVIDMVCADLPYGTTRCKWDSIIDLTELWEEYKRLIKPNGVIVLFAQTPFDKILGCSNIKMLRYEWIWEKTQATGHLNSKKAPMKSHENILVFYNKMPCYNPQKTIGHILKVSSSKSRGGCIDRSNKKGDYLYNKEYSQRVPDYRSTERYPRDVLKYSSDKQKTSLHPTQKPLGLIEYLIKTYTNEGNLVLDNCFGSNTTGLACKNLKRKYIGIEKDPEIFQIGVDRIK